MTHDELPPPIWVDTASGLNALAADLSAQTAIAVDTESNSLHAYRERVCLIQFSTPTTDYILDPLAFSNLPPDFRRLTSIFSNQAIEKVFHAAEYDLICMRRDFGWKVHSLFDTMIAARTLGWKEVGLASLLDTHFGVRQNKRHQRADWAERPLTPDQLAYARLDTHYLFLLRQKLAAELKAKECWAEAAEEFDRMANVNGAAAPVAFDQESFWRVSGARDLAPRQAALLRELFIYREDVARRMDRPPFKVMSEGTLLALAQAAPHTLDGLRSIPGMTSGQIQRHGARILEAVARGRKAPPQRPPGHERRPDDIVNRYDALHKWRKQKAKARGVESDVIVPRDVLWEIAAHPPQSAADFERMASFGPVRRAKYGAEIMEVLKNLVNGLNG